MFIGICYQRTESIEDSENPDVLKVDLQSALVMFIGICYQRTESIEDSENPPEDKGGVLPAVGSEVITEIQYVIIVYFCLLHC